jgi:hypothetical protein
LTISAERIWMELEEILIQPSRATGWSLLVELGLRPHLAVAWPGDPRADALAQARLGALPGGVISPELGLACVICDFSPAAVRETCLSLRLSNRLTDGVCWLVESLPLVRHQADLELADLKILMAERCWPDLLELLRADLIARGSQLARAEQIRSRAGAIRAEDVGPPPLITGDDLITMGFSAGPKFGEVLAAVYRRQLNEQLRTREEAMSLARKLLEDS